MGKAAATVVSTTAPVVTQGVSQTRLHIIILGLWFCLFLSALDSTIVTTALIKISSSFDALEQGTWLITAYLLTYNAFLMITARLSDVWGLKIMLLSCATIFLVASMACGAAQTMIQLIVFRAFQGIGGSGLYSLTFVSIMKLIVPEKIGFYSGVISSVFAVSNLLGPLLGGIISDRTTWRWIFFMNGPIVVVAIGLLFVAMPALKDGKTNRERIKGLDSVGGILSVCWPVPLIFALQEAGGAYKWSSGVIIGTLTIGIVLFFVFGLYETWITYKTPRDPIFPIHFLREPCMALILLSQFLVGMPFYVMFVQLPQRFQTVNFTSAERAGILLLPATCVTAVGAMLASVGTKKLAIEYIALIALSMICLSVGLLSSLPTSSEVWAGTYGYEIITGLGLGLTGPVFYILMGSTVSERDVSVGTGALNTVRTLGGCVAVAICSAIHREYTNDRLARLLSPEQIAAAQSSSTFIAQLPEALRKEIGEVFGRSYNRQFQVMLAFSGLNIIVGIMLAVARKRAGLLGQIPQRMESNEFMETTKDGEAGKEASDGKDVLGEEASKSSDEREKPTPISNELSIQEAGAQGTKNDTKI